MTSPTSRAADQTADQTADLVLFDGVCGLCHRVVTFTLCRDPARHFRFSPLQGELAHEILERHHRSADRLDTFYVVVNRGTHRERLIDRARAALYLCAVIGGPWRVFTLLGVLPTFVLDFGYRLVARVRYRLFGRFDTCPIPRPEDRDRFL